MLREVEQEYKELLRRLEEDENLTKEEIEIFKKNAIVHQSLIEVRRRAREQEEKRKSPERYRSVNSKVSKNVRTSMMISSQKFANASVIGQPLSTTNRYATTQR